MQSGHRFVSFSTPHSSLHKLSLSIYICSSNTASSSWLPRVFNSLCLPTLLRFIIPAIKSKQRRSTLVAIARPDFELTTRISDHKMCGVRSTITLRFFPDQVNLASVTSRISRLSAATLQAVFTSGVCELNTRSPTVQTQTLLPYIPAERAGPVLLALLNLATFSLSIARPRLRCKKVSIGSERKTRSAQRSLRRTARCAPRPSSSEPTRSHPQSFRFRSSRRRRARP